MGGVREEGEEKACVHVSSTEKSGKRKKQGELRNNA